MQSPTPAERALAARLDAVEAQLGASARSQQQYWTDPTGLGGDRRVGQTVLPGGVAVAGYLTPVCSIDGISGFGIAVFDESLSHWCVVACSGGGGGDGVPELLFTATPADPALEIGVTGDSGPPRLQANGDGSLTWSDGTDPAVALVELDPVRDTGIEAQVALLNLVPGERYQFTNFAVYGNNTAPDGSNVDPSIPAFVADMGAIDAGTGDTGPTAAGGFIGVSDSGHSPFPVSLASAGVGVLYDNANGTGLYFGQLGARTDINVAAPDGVTAPNYAIRVGGISWLGLGITHQGVMSFFTPSGYPTPANTLGLDSSGALVLTGLPAVNPGGTGRLWNNGGVLNIT